MTGLEKIVQQIQSEAQQAADAVIAQANAEAAEIANKAQEEGKAQIALVEAQSKTDVANALSAAKSAAALQVRRAVLEAKQEMIGKVIDNAQKSIYQLPDDEYFALILKMVKKFALPERGEILFSASDLKRLPADFSARIAEAAPAGLTVSSETRKIDGGFVLIYGGVEENCSFDALFYAARESLQDKVQELLFS